MANKRKSAEAVRSRDGPQQVDVISNDTSNDPTGHDETDMIHGIVNAVKTGISANSDTKQEYPDVSSPKIAHDKYVYRAMDDAAHTFHPQPSPSGGRGGQSTLQNSDGEDTVFLEGFGDFTPQPSGVNALGVDAFDSSKNLLNAPFKSHERATSNIYSFPCQISTLDCVDGAEILSDNKEYASPNHSLPSSDSNTRDRKIQDAKEYYAIEGNGSSDQCINPIEPLQRPWSDLHSFETIDYHGEDLMVGNIIGVETQGSRDNSIVEIREIRGLEDGGYLLLVFWYCSKEEMYRSGCKNKKKWPQGHSHMKSTHMQIIMWDTTNCKMSTEESRKFSPGMIFDWYHADPFINREGPTSMTGHRE